jgi:hypothetical protein
LTGDRRGGGKEGREWDHQRPLAVEAVCLRLSAKPRLVSLTIPDGLGAQSFPRRPLRVFLAYSAWWRSLSDRSGGSACILPCPGLPAFLRAVWLVQCPTRERHGARRGRGTRDSDVSSANLVSKWMEGPVGRGRGRVGGWSGFHSKSLAHVFVQLTTVPYARSPTIIVRRCSPT